MTAQELSLLVKLHDDTRNDIKSEIAQLRAEVHKWRDIGDETQKMSWKMSGGVAMLVVFLQGAIKAAEMYLSHRP